MPEYLAPGVYIEEIERGPQIILPVATSTAAFLGETERGPTRPRLVTSWNAYTRVFGGVYAPDRYLPYAVRGFFENGGRRCYIARIVGPAAGPPPPPPPPPAPPPPSPTPAAAQLANNSFTVTAIGPGEIAERTWVRIGPGTTLGQNGQPVGFRLQVFFYGTGEQLPAPAQIPTGPIQAGQPSPWDQPFPQPRFATPEDFNDLSFEPASPNYWDKRVNHENSAYVTLSSVTATAVPAAVTAALLDNAQASQAPTSNSFIGAADNVAARTGLSALELDPYREVAIIYAPSGRGVDDSTINAIVSHCENNRFRFAVIDCAQGQANPDAPNLQPRSRNDTSYAAFYYPWIRINDPRTDARIFVPPGGYMCGIYARSDNTRGVWKAPANEPVRGALELEFDIDQGTQEVLNPRGVNAIRRFPDRGIRIWGARTLSSNPLWRYVNVRRLLIFLEASIYNSTQWVVFEPNDNRLWARVRQTVILFLRTQWREGALFGAREEDAFSVAIGLGETMTDDDVNSGRLIIEVGVRPVYPAEFVIFRIFQQTQTQTRS